MDPVNPAPAGNPQLTTHLLVSHKKNKNFHPSKVSLKRVKVIRKQMQILNPAVPSEIYLNPNFITKRVRCGRSFQITDITLKQFSKGGLFSRHLEHTPWKSYLRLQYDGILSQTDETGREIESFINSTFLMKIFDWNGTELITVTEKETSLQRLQENVRSSTWVLSKKRLTGPTVMEAEFSWDGLQLKVGDSEMHKAMDTQPMKSLGNSSAFFDRHPSFSRRSDQKVRNILREIVRRKSLDHSESFNPLQDETTRLSNYLKYLCDRAGYVSPVSAEMLFLIHQMVERLVYYIEPMIVAIVDPVVDSPSQFTNSVLAIKMRDTFQKLCALKPQTAERLEEFLPSLESCLFCDWSEMLSLLISSNEEFFIRHLERFLASKSSVNKELLERFYVGRGSAMYRIMSGIVESLNCDEVAKTSDPFILACTNTKYQCWRDYNKLGISYTPEHITSPTKGSEFVTVINLDFPEKYNLWSVNVCEDTLIIEGPKQLMYICDLSAIIQKGKVDHQLSQVSTSFRMRSKTHGMENDRELQAISCFGRTDIANLEYKDGENGGLSKIRVYDLKEIAKLGSAGIKGSEYDIAAQVSMPERPISEVAFDRLVNNMFAVGYFAHNDQSATLATSLRLMLFQYRPSSSEMFMLTENSFQIDQQRLAQLPSDQDFGSYDQIIFGTHRKRIFAIADLHYSKPVTQIYCYHRKQFQLIGGTNCKTPGLYIMDRHNTVRFYNDTAYGGLHGIGCSPTIDHQMGMAHYKFGEYRLCF